jgi:hypothetical protein
MAKFVVNNQEFLVPLCEAVGVDINSTIRIILDLKIGEVAKAYVETFVDDSVLNIGFPEGFVIENDKISD